MRQTMFLIFLIGALIACKEQPRPAKTDAEWQKELTPDQYAVLREGATEKPFTGKYLDTETEGIYACVGCQNPVFNSENKYHSGTGWPAFDRAITNSVKLVEDHSGGMDRTEVRCAQCDGHLGHRFDDGPLDSTGKRYCINAVALTLTPK